MDRNSTQKGTTVALSIPVTHPGLFSHRAAADLLAVLSDNPYTGLGIRELSRVTDYTHRSVSQAVADLEAVDLVTTEQEGPKKLVRINSDRLETPDDPILSIPQPEFHRPVRDLETELRDELKDVRGMVLFGSVARGDADRRSDIDCFVLVGENQAVGQQTAHDVVETLQTRKYDGDRYTFHVLVESDESARQHGDQLRELFAEGRTLHETDALRDVKRETLTDG